MLYFTWRVGVRVSYTSALCVMLLFYLAGRILILKVFTLDQCHIMLPRRHNNLLALPRDSFTPTKFASTIRLTTLRYRASIYGKIFPASW